MAENKVITRIAPSPTGPLHIGTARTALFNYIFARQNKGTFILRIDDTDIERSQKAFEEDIIKELTWLGLKWDSFFKPSERAPLYTQYIEQLLETKWAFFCPHTPEELEKERTNQLQNKQPPRHLCNQKNKATSGVIRFDSKKIKEKEVTFKDLIRGEVSFKIELLGDFAIARSKGTALYNFASVVDDFDMNITHIIRGEDHISNTPKQIALQKALKFPQVQFAHLPLILNEDRSKLSKRKDPVSVNGYRTNGFLPEALLNFIALLGWNPGNNQEIISLDEMIDKFNFHDVQKGGAVFNIQKLEWINQQYIQSMDPIKLNQLLQQYTDIPISPDITQLIQSRLKKLTDVKIELQWLETPNYEKSLLQWKNTSPDILKNNMEKLEEIIKNISEKEFRITALQDNIMPFADREGRGEVLWPLRVALSGKEKSPGPFELMELLGKEETIKRIEYAKTLLN